MVEGYGLQAEYGSLDRDSIPPGLQGMKGGETESSNSHYECDRGYRVSCRLGSRFANHIERHEQAVKISPDWPELPSSMRIL